MVGGGTFDLARYRSSLKDSLKTVLAAAPLLTELTLQDSMGKASSVANGSVTRKINASNAIVHCEIAAAAASELGRGATLAVSVNAELMLRRKVGGKTFDLPCDPRELEAREVAYRSSGWGLGPSWEMSFWHRQQTEEWSLPDAALLKTDDADIAPSKTLVGIHYFAGWYPGPFSHWNLGPLPSKTSWTPQFPGRIPLLGNFTTNLSTIEAELRVADANGVDFFSVLWSDPHQVGGCSVGKWPKDPNYHPCTDTALAWMLNTTIWPSLKGGLHFMISYSTDFDSVGSKAQGMFTGDAGLQLFESYAATWVRAMAHPRYLKVDSRPVFKILGPYNFLAAQCNHNVTLAQALIHRFRAMAVAAGVGDPLIGGGWIDPNSAFPMPSGTYQGVAYDYTGTYNSAGRDPALGPCESGVVYPYAQLRDWRGGKFWGNHSHDAKPYVPNIVASFDPRPAKEKSCSFAQPTREEWTATLRDAKGFVEAPGARLGFPSPSGSVVPAITIYAWNEFAEGGIVAPTRGQGYMMVEAIGEVFGKGRAAAAKTDDSKGSKRRRNVLYIVYDDLRPDLSLYNLSFMRTPNLQKLADTGTVFDRAYCQQ